MPLRVYIPEDRSILNRKDLLGLFLVISCCFSSAHAENQAYDIAFLQKWDRVVKAYYAKTPPLPLTVIKKINNDINKYPYISDMDNYGVAEYWATPEEFYAHGGGDCEDYAIAKYFRLLDEGMPVKDMAIVVGTKPNPPTPHAALQISYKGKKIYLDNLSNNLNLEAAYLKNFTPIYYANDNFFGRNQTLQAGTTKFTPSGMDNISTTQKE